MLGAESERGTVTLVAGSHSHGFPYHDTDPWDNCLLLIGDTGYTFNGRTNGASLHLDLDVSQPSPRGKIRFAGKMLRARDGAPVDIELEIPVALTGLPTRLLGESYNFLELDGAVGMKYTPYSLSGDAGRIRVAGADLALAGIRGSCEHGQLTNLKAHDFALKYAYVGVACPGDDGYGIIDFTSHALFDDGIVSKAVDWYLRKSASALMTIEDGKLTDGNPHGVYSPPQDDPEVVLFENQVDLGPAVLQRQMIKTRDKAGRVLHGLREIFTAKPGPKKRTFHLNRAQVNVVLFLLVVLDVFLSTVAICFPEHWSQTFHAMPYDDPAGLLRRTGSVWVAFTLLQAIALFRWQKQSYWLPLIAGVRFTELFSDWVTIIAAKQMTTLGTAALLISPPGNLLFGLILISTYKRLKDGPLPGGSFFTRPWS
ncbi:MAG: hypothetical protein E6J90_28950 [Deltaproteobacteria bacterium]|nr:MAG: hypothetical protein E6J90_28950 [Deltaproteobacteria bacterium]